MSLVGKEIPSNKINFTLNSVIIIKQNMDIKTNHHDMNSKIIITLFSSFAELERNLISVRTKETLAVKKAKAKD